MGFAETYIRIFEDDTASFLQRNHVSLKTGFLAENPPLLLPYHTGHSERDNAFKIYDTLAHGLPPLAKEKKMAETVRQLPIPDWPIDDLSWPATNRLMFVLAMTLHAYLHELYPYASQKELQEDHRPKSVPPQLAIPLWKLHKKLGIEPCMSYYFYSPWNYYLWEPQEPIDLDNIEPIHTFTGSRDEKWFIKIHQMIDYTLAPTIQELLVALGLSIRKELWGDPVIAARIMRSLENSIGPVSRIAGILARMDEHCDPASYFRQVRGFYGLPLNLLFEGVEELAGKLLNLLGETGGQDTTIHFLKIVLGIDLSRDAYFPKMQLHMPRCFREVLSVASRSLLRQFAIWQEKHGNEKPKELYNALVAGLDNFEEEHRVRAVGRYISDFGDSHGTGKPPTSWLEKVQKHTRSYYIR